MALCFTLSMPGVASWNGKWTGADTLYAIIRNVRKTKAATEKAQALIKTGYFYYGFGDGWAAAVTVRAVDAREAAKIRKASKGFCGYDWMVESIIERGEIESTSQRIKRLQGQEVQTCPSDKTPPTP